MSYLGHPEIMPMKPWHMGFLTTAQMSRVEKVSFQQKKTDELDSNAAADYNAFVFITQLLQTLYFLTLKFQASSHLLWLYSPVFLFLLLIV